MGIGGDGSSSGLRDYGFRKLFLLTLDSMCIVNHSMV